MTRKYALVSTGPLSGKSTLAKHLEREYGFIRADHSRSLVEAFVAQWNAQEADGLRAITVDEVYRDKEKWRPSLQEFGYTSGFNDPLKAVRWAKYTLREWLQYKPERNVVFDSLRGEGQAQVMRDLGFQIVQLEIDDETRCERARMRGFECRPLLTAMDLHPELERGIKHPDIVLNASLPVEVLGKILVQVPEGAHGIQIFSSYVH
jgi:hypothetical protein